MAKFNYLRSKDTAARLIARFGMDAELLRPAGMEGPEWNPEPGPEPAPEPVKIVESQYSAMEIDGTLIQQTDHKFLLSTEGVTVPPTVADRLRVGPNTYELINVSPLSPGGTIVMWELQGRG